MSVPIKFLRFFLLPIFLKVMTNLLILSSFTTGKHPISLPQLNKLKLTALLPQAAWKAKSQLHRDRIFMTILLYL